MEEQNNTNIFFPTIAILFVFSIHVYSLISTLEESYPVPCLICLFSWVLSIGLLIIVVTKLIREKCSLNACLWMTALFLNIFLHYPLGLVYLNIRANLLRDVAAKSKPLIAAIERYHNYRGEYPESLEDLIPEFISTIPETKISTKSDYMYYKEKEGGYQLTIRFQGKFLNQATFTYEPERKDKSPDSDEKYEWFDGWHYCPPDYL